jgi:hypothetical protein
MAGSQSDDRVVPLRPRRPRADNDNRNVVAPEQPVGDLRRFEAREDAPDDYRHRMVVNALALLVCIFLVGAGVWIANTMAQMRKDQDCVLSGRRGCSPVDVPVNSRW